jgi:D-xylose transport system substrate-binding protein
MKLNRVLVIAFTLMIVAGMIAGCAAPATPAPAPAPADTQAPAATAAPAATVAPADTQAPAATVAPAPATSGKIKVGLSFSDYATERWPIEAAQMTQLLQKKGYEVISQEADHDVKLQSDQIDNMVAQGVKGLIIVAEDGAAAVTPVEKAAAAGVKVIAYDRLIKTDKISAYLSFDNVEVGRQQALGVLKALGIPGSTTWTKDNPVKMVLSGGSPTDNNAVLFRQGQMEKLQPFIDSGIIKVVADQWVDNWDPAKAESIMENALTANKNQIDAVIASNDGTAGGAVQALQAQKLTIPISGQDATAAGANLIVKGLQTVTVYKDTRVLAAKAVEVIDLLINGKAVDGMKDTKISDLTGKTDAQGTVPVLLLPVVEVTKDNVYDVIVKSGFQKYDDVYRDIPADKLPPKP